MRRFFALLFLYCASFAPASAQITQSQIDTLITTGFLSCGNGCITALELRTVLEQMNAAAFQVQGSGGQIGPVAAAGSPLTITGLWAFTTAPTVPTQSPGDNSTKAASTAYADAASGSNANVLYAKNFSGADLGAKISACIAALPTFGGTCDARGVSNVATSAGFTATRSGYTLLMPCGFFTWTSPIIVGPAVSGVVWTGCGSSFTASGSINFWGGGATGPLLDLRSVRDSTFEDFTINAISSTPLAEGIRRETWPGSISTNVRFRNLLISGNIANALGKGIRWCTGADCGNGVIIGNNDLDTLYNVTVSNYTNCAFSIEGTQSKTHTFFNSQFGGQSYSQRGVCTTQGFGTGIADPLVVATNGTSGCANGTFPVVGGTGVGAAATVTITTSGGVVTSMAVATTGTYSNAVPPSPTSLSGTACSVAPTFTWSNFGSGISSSGLTLETNGTSGCIAGTYPVVGGTGTAATITIGVAGNVVTTLTLATAGVYSVVPPAVASLSGTGCSVAPTFAFGTNSTTNAGSYRWYGGAGGSNQVADFDLGAVTDFLKIDSCNFESSRRLLQTGGASSASWTITIDGCRWTANAINPDGKMIIYQDRGPLNITGLQVENGGSTVPVILSIESSGTPEVGNAIGNAIQTASAAAGYTPFVCGVSTSVSCWSAIGNTVTDNSNNRFQVPNVLQANPLTVAMLPACTAQRKGDGQFVTDQNTAVAYHGAVTGGGSTQQNVRCDGTNWYQD